MGTLTIAAVLLAILLVLLMGGVWIAISLAAVAWFTCHCLSFRLIRAVPVRNPVRT